ncbi:MAG: cation diffusion facilitator family transporter [Thermoplasmata archaeon]|nr:cation diffusion facilitator family transporter [Thermoplasmata archaeon]
MPILPHGESEGATGVSRRLKINLLLAAVVLVFETIGAWQGRSLALLLDALHNIPDLLAFAAASLAVSATLRGVSEEYTFGLHRTEVLAGFANAAAITGLGVGFGATAAWSLLNHAPVLGAAPSAFWVLAVALPTIGVRLAAALLLRPGLAASRDINLRGVFRHVTSDLVVTGTVVTVGVVLLLRPALGWVDAGASLLLGVFLVALSAPLFRDSYRLLTDKMPQGLSVERVRATALRVPGVRELHDVHVWAICSNFTSLTAHVLLADVSVRQSMVVITELRRRMASELGIDHAVFEVETGPPPPHVAAPSGSRTFPS